MIIEIQKCDKDVKTQNVIIEITSYLFVVRFEHNNSLIYQINNNSCNAEN